MLYEKEVPNSTPAPADYVEQVDSSGLTRNVTWPSLTAYLPPKDKATGTAVIICPGGGYAVLAPAVKSAALAREFNKAGIAAFVLKYRLPNDAVMTDKSIAPLQDGQMAVLTLRKRAKEWNINPDKIGFVGISAGGHLASTAGTQFGRPVIENKEHISLRPDFMVLVYPVILFDTAIASGVRERLVGKDAPQELLDLYSSEKHVSVNTPPTFLVHAADDDTVPVKNSLLFFNALLDANVRTSMHILQSGNHGFQYDHPGPDVRWFDWCLNWLHENGF
ncbi:alpha/beta hydrolase [Chitinophaga barathri]|uniref:Alpha/beta hydrolase n=2 Tax=Chitinophaga barathri TaxID=1647451 RepID=A0A3N4MGJ6_9BACT|nr:alpha/beta hydrolase [Chitinophaga barathri]